MKPTPPKPDVTQIRVGEHKIGIIGLEQTLQQMAESHHQQADDVIADKLFQQLSLRNYIPDHARPRYQKAFLRELKRFCGISVEGESGDQLEIKVLGRQCTRCDQLLDDIRELLGEFGLAADLEHIKDPEAVSSAGVSGLPAVFINNRVMIAGKPPSRNELKGWLSKFKLENCQK